ncbi:hypothetical protein LCM10_15325 [Rossellomorea aquimaris]|uniref:hypothetical protein n=1 Tax=Rossellomorea aquimaris TaxID=189382 RepID=UPI001CD45323|nr:hypothetical protein [Rossellomorea aquimaris]MCA1056369.1 hypothetical protein [Rossellomorea aquimaris]
MKLVKVEKYVSWPNGLGAIAVLSVLIFQVIWIPSYAATWDMVDFALGVLHFDIYQMRPHFPGYPYFILGGTAIHVLVDDPVRALTLFNILLYASSMIPLFLLVRKVVRPSYALMAMAIIYTSSYTVLMVHQPMSEGAAIAVMWWYVWSLMLANRKSHNGFLILPLFLFSLLLGIRLSYLALGTGILVVFFYKLKKGSLKPSETPLYLLIAVLFQLLWVTGISLSEGGYQSFMRLAFSFTSGHFQEWGGAIGASELSLWDRVLKLIFINTAWTGWFHQSVPLLFLVIVSILLLRHTRFGNSEMKGLLLVLMGSYFIWALFAQNVVKPRHALPLIGIAIFFAAAKMFSRKHSRIGLILLCCILMVQVTLTGKSLYSHSSDRPAVYQMADYLEKQEQPLIVYTWEESRVLQYLSVPYLHKKVQTYEVFATDIGYYPDRDIYVTDKVVEGFKSQGKSIESFIKVQKKFHSSKLIDPVYYDLTLYKWENPKIQQREGENG